MRNLVNTYVDQFRQDRQKQIKLAAVLAALAVIVAGVVFWQLHSTGVAMTNEVFCGMEEHAHDDSCYEQVLVCGMDESEPAEGHVHSDACYETVETLVCQDESEEHVHTDDCYVTEQNLVCGLEESEGAEGHVHSDACYETVLTCEIPEHTHTIECMNDEEADVETAEDWEATLPEELSGVWSQDVVSIAESQIGYTESERNFQLADDGETRQGYTRYGAWYGNEYGDWDAMFASFCLNYAGVPEEEFPEASGVYAWVTELGNAGMYVPANKFTPQVGDLAFFDLDEDGQADTVGVISYLSSKDIYVIEGNYEDAVTEQTYDLDDNQIIGYGILPDQPGVEAEPVTLVQQTLEATIYSDASCVKTLSAAENITLSGMMPENASVIAYPVDVTIGDMTILAAYDITIYDENGHEFEPEDGTIEVSISNSAIRSALGNNEEPVVYHINDHTDVLEEVSKVSTSDGMVEFTAESFSIYIVGDNDGYYHPGDEGEPITVYTVEFYLYEFDNNDINTRGPILTSTQYVAEEGYLTEPAVPEYEHHAFDGWFTEMQESAEVEPGFLYDFSKTLGVNLTTWGSGYDLADHHTIELYTDYDPVFFVYYMIDENMWDEEATESVWVDEYTEKYHPGETLDTSGVESMLQTELGNSKAVTAWYDEPPEIDSNGNLQWTGKIWTSGMEVTDDLKLYPYIDNVIWIYFTMVDEEFGEDVDVEAAEPTYVLASATTLEGVLPGAEDVHLSGYVFDHWYALVDVDNGDGSTTTKKVDVTEDSNPQELKNSEGWIDLYAVWNPAKVGYTVNIWRQKATDGQAGLDQKVVQTGETYDEYIKYYDYAESITVSSDESTLKTGTSPDASILDEYSKKGEKVYQGTGEYNGFEYNQTRSENDIADKVMASDGSTIINVFYDRVTVTWNFHSTNSSNQMNNNNIWGTLIGLYNTNLTPTNGSEPGGSLSEWTLYPTTSTGLFGSTTTTYHNWVSDVDGTSSTTIFEAEFVFKQSSNPETTNFWYGSESSGVYIYYYLEVTNEATQVDENGDKAAEAEEDNVDYVHTVTSNGETTEYVFERRIQLSSTATKYTINNKFVGYNVAKLCTVSFRTSGSGNNQTTTTTYGTVSSIEVGDYIGGGTSAISNNYCIFCDANTYYIDLYSNHDGEQLVESLPYKYGADLSDLELPTELDAERYGPAYYYHFTGTWWEDPTFTAEFDLPSTMPGNNLAAYADWELNDITVTFNSYVESDLYEILEGIYGEENITTNSNGTDGLWSYSIILKATELLEYDLDNGLHASDGDEYTFTGWLNVDSGKVFNFKTTLYDDITLEAMWHEEETYYQIVYVINLDGYAEDTGDDPYRLGNPHGIEGSAEVRLLDDFEDEFKISENQYDKFVCWNTAADGTGISYYPEEEIFWQRVDTSETAENVYYYNGTYYYVIYAVWETENEAVLHVDYNYPGGTVDEGVEYDDAYITVSNLGEFDLSNDDEEDNFHALHEGNEITINGVTYRFAGWSTNAKDDDATYTKDDVNIQADATVAVDNVDTDADGFNTIYAVWLAELQFTIEKTDKTSNVALDGAVFTLSYTDADDTTYYYTSIDDKYVWVEADDPENPPTVTLGSIRFHDTEGEFTGDEVFTLTEIMAPEGYMELNGSITFYWDVDANEVVISQKVYGRNENPLAVADGGVLTVMNEPEFSVDVYKIDENEDPLSSVDFYLYRTAADGSYERAVFSHSWNPNTYYLEDWFNPDEEWLNGFTIETDSNGYFRIEWLEPGTYTLYEVTTNQGYVLPSEGIEFTVNEDGSISSNWWNDELEGLQIVNEPESFSVYKINDEGNPLEGAKFVLGEIYYDPPTVSTQIGDSDWYYDFLILEKDNEGKYVFDTWTDDMNDATEVVTDSNGLINVSGVPTRQYYFLVETEAPAGYAKLEEYIIFYVDEYGVITLYSNDEHVSTDGSTIKVTDDDSIFDVLIYKYDPDRYRETYMSTDVEVYDVTNYSLEGAEFILSRSVTGENDEGEYEEYAVVEYDEGIGAYTVTEWTSNEEQASTLKSIDNGNVWILNLEADTYTLTETKAPDNYELLTVPIVFTVDSEGIITVTEESPAVIDNGRICVANTEITGAFELDKTDKDGNVLSGAEFILGYFGEMQITQISDTQPYLATEDGKYYYYYAILDYDDTSGSYVFNWDDYGLDDIEYATKLTTDDNGIICIENLPVTSIYESGFFLIETKAPDGYNLLEDPIVFKVSDDGTIQIAVGNIYASMNDDGTVMTVENVPGSQLPHTGGIGTWIYTIAGVLLIGGAATLLVYRKRRAV